MNILGIAHGHNASVCLVRDGLVTFAQSEERLNRIKNSFGFPVQTLELVFSDLVGRDDLDEVVLFEQEVPPLADTIEAGFEPRQFEMSIDSGRINRLRFAPRALVAARWAYRQRRAQWLSRASRQHAVHRELGSAIGIDAHRIRAVRHHDAHAYSAVPNLGASPALVFTLDASGDGECATVQGWDGSRLTSLSRTDHRHSLGFYYAYTTALLGMKAGEHEFKVMGLAPYAAPARVDRVLAKLRRLIDVDDGEWRSKVYGIGIAKTLEQVFRFERFDTIAGAVQRLTEELVLAWVRHWTRTQRCGRVGLAGGVFMNVRVVQLIAEMEGVEEVFVVPSAGDESCAIGAAVAGSLDRGVGVAPLRDLYLGTGFGDAEARAAVASLDPTRYRITENVDADRVATLLANGEVVARVVGRMEFGARALGNRSILANPSDRSVVARINDHIKSRDFWMPFAPSILHEDMSCYVEPTHATFAPYMTVTFDATPRGRADLAAAIHPRDGTTRPQEVVRDWNPDFHALITRFKAKTGIGALLNTSFNLHGEPNVCSPVDAVRTLERSGLRYLVLGSSLIEKLDASPT